MERLFSERGILQPEIHSSGGGNSGPHVHHHAEIPLMPFYMLAIGFK
jgi:hypothetical protein